MTLSMAYKELKAWSGAQVEADTAVTHTHTLHALATARDLTLSQVRTALRKALLRHESLHRASDSEQLYLWNQVRMIREPVIPRAMRPVANQMAPLRLQLKSAIIHHIMTMSNFRNRVDPQPADTGEHCKMWQRRRHVLQMHNHLAWSNEGSMNNILKKSSPGGDCTTMDSKLLTDVSTCSVGGKAAPNC